VPRPSRNPRPAGPLRHGRAGGAARERAGLRGRGHTGRGGGEVGRRCLHLGDAAGEIRGNRGAAPADEVGKLGGAFGDLPAEVREFAQHERQP
jgi:hypothetical protein